MDGREVLDYYRTRFQLEFCFRDGKQHAGITNCQSTDFRKLDFHFNASLAAVNLAKAACKRLGITYSISSCKSFIHNAYMLERFICVFGISPDPQVIDKLFKELILFTVFNYIAYEKFTLNLHVYISVLGVGLAQESSTSCLAYILDITQGKPAPNVKISLCQAAYRWKMVDGGGETDWWKWSW